MNGEIICVGTELLLGDILNTNAQFLSAELAALGISIYNQSVVGDNEQRIRLLLAEAVKRSKIIVFTGGLGPTEDDLTKESVAAFFGLPLVEDGQSLKHIEDYFKRTGRKPASSNFKQALAPSGAHIFKNDVGTAPGYAIESHGCTVIIMPGPPSEMQPMFLNYVKPYLRSLTDSTLVSHNINIFGEMESAVEEKVKRFTKLSNPTTAPYAKEGEVRLRVTASGGSCSAADSLCRPVIQEITKAVGDSVYGIDSKGLQYEVVRLLKEKGMKIATAESCTAGLLSALITEVAGASEVFEFGISAYANRIKTEALGVPQYILEKYGAVSEHTAAYMALGVRKLADADIGLGITGVAGPGASENKPVGLVYIALADRNNIWVRKTTLGHGSDEREKVRRNSAKTALDLARRYLCSLPYTMQGGFKIGTAPTVLNSQPPIAGFNNADFEVSESTPDSQHLPSADLPDTSGAGTDLPESGRSGGSSDKQPGRRRDKKKSFFHSLFFARPGDDEHLPSSLGACDLKKQSESKEKNGGPISFLRSLFPLREDSAADKARKSIFLSTLLLLAVFTAVIVGYSTQIADNRRLLAELRQSYNPADIIKNEDETFECFAPLQKINPETVAWLKIDGTDIDNPVVAHGDNIYYQNHLFSGGKNRYGCLYLDCAAQLSENYQSQNLVIYGNNMTDGEMFGELEKYRNIHYYTQHPYIKLHTLYKNAEYKIFAVIIADEEDEGSSDFQYNRSDFATQTDFLEWIANVRQRSIFETDIDIKTGDKILTLSTDVDDFKGACIAVYARKLRYDEDSSAGTNTVRVNANVRYPQAYYDLKSMRNPFLTDNGSNKSASSGNS